MSGERLAKTRVLIVDDSPVARQLLTYVLQSDPAIEIVGTASSGEEALEAAAQKKPDVITMDYHMPNMNGMDATRQIMETHPVPIVIVSGTTAPSEVAVAHSMLDAGALAVLQKPPGLGDSRHAACARELVETVKLMAEVKVVKRWPRRHTHGPPAPPRLRAELKRAQNEVRLVVIGASTGGPLVLHKMLSALPQSFPVPIAIVQHISSGFTAGFAAWLAQSCEIKVHVAIHGEYMLPGHAYIAPDEVHMTVTRDGRIALSSTAPENGHRPAVSQLFRSAAAAYGRNAVGVLLTGMGADGAAELKLMKDQGAITIAQDRATSVVHGMPGAAIQLDAATHVLALTAIAEALKTLVEHGSAR